MWGPSRPIFPRSPHRADPAATPRFLFYLLVHSFILFLVDHDSFPARRRRVRLTNSTFSNNTATLLGGAVAVQLQPPGPSSPAHNSTSPILVSSGNRLQYNLANFGSGVYLSGFAAPNLTALAATLSDICNASSSSSSQSGCPALSLDQLLLLYTQPVLDTAAILLQQQQSGSGSSDHPRSRPSRRRSRPQATFSWTSTLGPFLPPRPPPSVQPWPAPPGARGRAPAHSPLEGGPLRRTT